MDYFALLREREKEQKKREQLKKHLERTDSDQPPNKDQPKKRTSFEPKERLS